LLELIDNPLLNALAIRFTLDEQLVLNLVRHAAFDEVTHVLPIGCLISRSLPFRKLDLPICHMYFSWLGGVETLDDFIIFLLKCFNGRVNLERSLKLVITLTGANLSGKLGSSLDRVDYKGMQGRS
jgi:hypothetical protein